MNIRGVKSPESEFILTGTVIFLADALIIAHISPEHDQTVISWLSPPHSLHTGSWR